MKDYPQRKLVRLPHYNYSTPGAYFITICTKHRQRILSRILTGTGVPDGPPYPTILVGTGVPDGPQLELLPCGKIAEKHLKQLDAFYDNIQIDRYVIMPNHIHLLLFVKDNPPATPENGPSTTPENGPSRTPVPTGEAETLQNSIVSRFVSTFKRFSNKELGYNIWQSRFNDHIIRNRQDYEKHLTYICENPLRWHYDELYADD